MDTFEGLKLALMLFCLALLIRQELDRYNTWRIQALFTANPAKAARLDLPKPAPETLVFVNAETGEEIFSLVFDTIAGYQVVPPSQRRH